MNNWHIKPIEEVFSDNTFVLIDGRIIENKAHKTQKGKFDSALITSDTKSVISF